jgi:Protein of unknown function (DUF1194)
MKKATFPRRGSLFQKPITCLMSLGIAWIGLETKAAAESVDSELVLLVDITPRGLNASEFDQVMESYATAFTSSQVLDSIQSGAYGKIAVSIMFYGNASTQVVGIPWMMIGNSVEAETFAALARAVNRPFSIGSPSVASALTAATLSFGTETGGASNGFESSAQIIEIAAASVPTGGTAAVEAARDGALASGVELINSIALGNRSAAIANYYAANVIGGEAGGVVATSNTSPINGGLTGMLTNQVSGGVAAGASESLSAVPEPSSSLALLSGLALLLIRRRQS